MTSEVRTLRSKRPWGSTTGPGLSGPGTVIFRVRNAHPSASMLVLAGSRSSYNPNESTYDMGNYLLHTGLNMQHVRRLTIVPTDANGPGASRSTTPADWRERSCSRLSSAIRTASSSAARRRRSTRLVRLGDLSSTNHGQRSRRRTSSACVSVIA